jgi:anthranilate 1,2-dioxygenase small subunit
VKRPTPRRSAGSIPSRRRGVYQTDQEGQTRLFATGLYCDRILVEADGLKFRDKFVLLDTFAVPSLLATPL